MPDAGDPDRERDRPRGLHRGRRGAGDFGSLSIRVQPADADIFIDGERWQSAGGERLVVETPAGRRIVEIRKAGSRTFSQEIDVRPGEVYVLNVSLRGDE